MGTALPPTSQQSETSRSGPLRPARADTPTNAGVVVPQFSVTVELSVLALQNLKTKGSRV